MNLSMNRGAGAPRMPDLVNPCLVLLLVGY